MHPHVFGKEGQAWLAGKRPSQVDEGLVGGSAIGSGLELWLAGVNMESLIMEFWRMENRGQYSCRGTVQFKPNSGLKVQERI